jgi:CPA2 family monovalent cation:H+ antiporter-2
VALGMLVDPAFLLTHASLVIALIGVLVIGKLLITGGALLAAGVDHHTATVTAALMAQMGEFSFVLAGVGLASGIVDDDQYGLILATALGSIVLVVPLLATTPMLTAVAEYLPGVATHERALAGGALEHDTLTRHVVICGFGRVGAELGAALGRRGFSYTVIERNPAVVRSLRQRGIAAFYGDAGVEALLVRAGIDRARTLAITTPDLVAARAAITHARRLNPQIRVITRASTGSEVNILGQAGVDDVVQPEFEAGLEFVRQVLRWHGVTTQEVALVLSGRRKAFYQPEAASAESPQWRKP